ncbi:Uncharacterised protein [Pseudomonas aeruginosa]|nr:Uncharacterised protein [Pseudomonas aeruginosa]
MDGDEVFIDGPSVGLVLKVQKPLPSVFIGAFAQVVEEWPVLLQRRHELFHDFTGLVVQSLSAGRGKGRVQRSLHVAGQTAIPLFTAIAAGAQPLCGGRTTQQGPAFDEAGDAARVVDIHVAAQHLGRQRNGDVVIGFLGAPLVAVGVTVRHRPQRQKVVTEVIVQLDEARIQTALGVDGGHIGKARRDTCRIGCDGRYLVPRDA